MTVQHNFVIHIVTNAARKTKSRQPSFCHISASSGHIYLSANRSFKRKINFFDGVRKHFILNKL